MADTTQVFTLEELQAMGSRELDVLVMKLKGHEITPDITRDNRTWHFWDKNENYVDTAIADSEEKAWLLCAPHPSTDATAALLLLEDMKGVDVFTSLEGSSATSSTFAVNIQGKPSVAEPRAITIAYILHTQSKQS
jgi:hypothetical protein